MGRTEKHGDVPVRLSSYETPRSLFATWHTNAASIGAVGASIAVVVEAVVACSALRESAMTALV